MIFKIGSDTSLKVELTAWRGNLSIINDPDFAFKPIIIECTYELSRSPYISIGSSDAILILSPFIIIAFFRIPGRTPVLVISLPTIGIIAWLYNNKRKDALLEEIS